MPSEQQTTHCYNCEAGQIRCSIKPHTKYRCSTCKLVVSSSKPTCKNHPESGSYATFHAGQEIVKRCRVCGGTGKVAFHPASPQSSSPFSLPVKNDLKPVVDGLERSLKFDRSFLAKLRAGKTQPTQLISAVVQHIKQYQPQKAIAALRQGLLPSQVLEEIQHKTQVDKWTEKSRLANIVMWSLAMFLENKTEELTIQAIADTSASLLGRSLSGQASIDHNALGVRLEKPELSDALELLLQWCSQSLGSDAFEESGSLVNIYYDWFYLVRSGNIWQACHEVGRTQESHAIKIGVGIDWASKAVVSLIMHGEHHNNDSISLEKQLRNTRRSGLVHISDLGPFSSKRMVEIQEARDYFIIKLKKGVKYSQVHPIFLGEYQFELDNPGKTGIRLLEEKLIRLESNPELEDVRYLRFQFHSQRTGQFESIELLTSLPLAAEEVIRAHAQRWVATETEFNMLEHQFGLEKLYLKKPEKVWPLLLLVFCGKMLMELTYRGIHQLHGSSRVQKGSMSMQTASFRRGFANFVTAILCNIEDPFSQIQACQDPYCCFRNNNGVRRK